jgi:alpha-glucosidase (family GH31 glycosyl hydrolase)
MDVARGYASRGYPISLIIIDYFSWAPGPLGDETLPSECWPDPAGMVEELKAMGVEVMLSPYFHEVTEGSKYYATAAKEGYLALNAAKQPAKVAYSSGFLYDVYQEEARQYAWSAVAQGYLQPYNLHHWWLDCDEPCGDEQGISELLYRNGTWPASFVGAAFPHMVDRSVHRCIVHHAMIGLCGAAMYIVVHLKVRASVRVAQDGVGGNNQGQPVPQQRHAWPLCLGGLSALRGRGLVWGHELQFRELESTVPGRAEPCDVRDP